LCSYVYKGALIGQIARGFLFKCSGISKTACKKEDKGRFSLFFPQFVNFFKKIAREKPLLLLPEILYLLVFLPLTSQDSNTPFDEI
jgi:hypothetical protein